MGNPVYGNIASQTEHRFDAIVVGSGISGGWAAKELCEKGLKTLVLERGRNVVHIKDYHTAFMNPWDFPLKLSNSNQDFADSPVQSTAFDAATRQFFVNDREHPYLQANPFNWIRGYQVGGRSLTWGRQCYRLSDLDFEANAKDGHGVDWPVRYRDLAPWYDYVEKFVGISGRAENLPHLPDGQFLPPMDMNCAEEAFAERIKGAYQDRTVTIGRVANLTTPVNGRGPCQLRNLCARGCPFTGYFSSNGATLPAAEATGNLSVVYDAIVTEVIYDDKTRKATGVRVMDAHTKQTTEYFARVIFLNASTINTAAILLRSRSVRFPDGLGNDSGEVGHNLMDHFLGAGGQGELEGLADKYYFGRRPTGIYIPRFRNLGTDAGQKNFVRGYGYQGVGLREGWQDRQYEAGFGSDFKQRLLKPGKWTLWLGAWGETLPYHDNRIELDEGRRDSWGLSLVKVHFKYGDNEKAMRRDVQDAAVEMLGKAGFSNASRFDYKQAPGQAVHEMGTARMGRDPKTSVLNGNNQVHAVPNLFITDGSCMTSSACQNPSLTYMALTARACDFAVAELKKGNL